MLDFLQTFGCSLGLSAAATFLFTRPLVARILRDRQDHGQMTEAARERILAMRQSSLVYLLFEPLLSVFGRHDWTRRLINLERLEQSLRSAALEITLPVDEFAGLLVTRGMLVSLGTFVLGTSSFSLLSALALALFAGLATVWWGARQLHARAEKRRQQVRRRLPYVIDLLAMQIHAGSSFRQALSLVAKELREHPLGLELRRLLSECDRGTPLADALESLAQRLHTDEIKEFVKAIQNGHRRGTEMSQTLQNLTGQFLQRRTERLETLAGRLQVNIAFPGFLVMGACMLIILGPILLQAIITNQIKF